MKLLHTADWHVGKTLQGEPRGDEYKNVLAEITGIAQREQVDAILVAGDLFDSGSPSPMAEQIVFRALLDMRDIAPVVVIPGNHDNDNRLRAFAPVFKHARVAVRAGLKKEPLLIETAGGPLRVAAVPWLSQRYITRVADLMAKDADDLSGQYSARMRSVVKTLTEDFTEDAVNVVLGHMTIVGGELGGGERTAQTIFDYYVDATIFPAQAHYAALGHLHKAQKMAGPCPIWYSGAPMHLDFSDSADSKSVLLVEAEPNVPATVTPLELTSGRRLRTIKGTLEQLAALGDQGEDYLRVVVLEQARIGLGDEIRTMFSNAVKIIVDSETTGDDSPRIDRSQASPHDLFEEYLGHKGISDDRLLRFFDELLEEAHASDPA
ncbi:MAG: exonuclease SbcCD subunit D [Actinomycetota bacterium]